MEKNWTPNENQRKFLEILKEYPDGVTLQQIQIDKGLKIATGSINNAHMKELVDSTDGEFLCDLVFNGVKIGTAKKPWKIYKLKK